MKENAYVPFCSCRCSTQPMGHEGMFPARSSASPDCCGALIVLSHTQHASLPRTGGVVTHERALRERKGATYLSKAEGVDHIGGQAERNLFRFFEVQPLPEETVKVHMNAFACRGIEQYVFTMAITQPECGNAVSRDTVLPRKGRALPDNVTNHRHDSS